MPVASSSAGALPLTGALAFWHLVVLVALFGVGAAFFTPAFEALVPDIVPQSQLAAANALDQFVRPMMLRLVGPALGGVLVAGVGTGVAFAVDAATFLVAVAAVAFMRPHPHIRSEQLGSSIGAIAEGLRFVRRRVWLWGTLASAAVAYLVFMGPAEVLLPYVIKNEIGGSARDLGLVFAAGGTGAIAAALVMGQRGQPRRDVTVMYATWTLATLAVAGYGLATATWQLMLAPSCSRIRNARHTRRSSGDRRRSHARRPLPARHARHRTRPSRRPALSSASGEGTAARRG
ncbi:MAG TPA: MFS transporter [Gaiellaceae bacterium]|nr:MFS transporter [Gaiellaceae bacterium]